MTTRSRAAPRKRHPARCPRTAGQALVETGLVFIILAFLIFGGVSVLQTLTVQFTVNQAVRTAAHEAALAG